MEDFAATRPFDVLRLAGDYDTVLHRVSQHAYQDDQDRLFAAIALGDLRLEERASEVVHDLREGPELVRWRAVERDLLRGGRGQRDLAVASSVADLVASARRGALDDPLDVYVAARALLAEGLRIRKSEQGAAELAERAYWEARLLFQDIGRPDGVADAERLLGQLYVWQGAPQGIPSLTAALAGWHLVAARHAEAARQLREAHDLPAAPVAPGGHNAGTTLYELGMAFHDAGRYLQAADTFAAAAALYHPAADPSARARLLQARASSLVELGRLEEAETHLKDPVFARVEDYRKMVRLRDLSRIALRRGDLEGAEGHVREAAAVYGARDVVGDFGARTLRCQEIRVRAARAEPAARARLAAELERIAGHYRDARELPHAVLTLRDAAETFHGAGDGANATRALEQARALAQAHGLDAMLPELRILGLGALFAGTVDVEGGGHRGYVVIRTLRRDALGQVSLAIDSRSNRRVALDVGPPADAAAVQQEVEIGQALQAVAAEGLPRVHDVGTLVLAGERRAFRAHEVVNGPTLDLVLDRFPSPRAVLRLVSVLAGALQALHDGGLVHGAVAPDNVIVRPEGGGDPVLVALGSTSYRSAPRARAAPGPFAAPEQLDGRPADAPADVFALGAILLRWLGRAPLPARPRRVLRRRLRYRSVVPARVDDPALQELLLGPLAVDPAARPSAGELARALAPLWTPRD